MAELYVPPQYKKTTVAPPAPPKEPAKLTVQDYREMVDYAISLEEAAQVVLTQNETLRDQNASLLKANQKLSADLDAARAQIKQLKRQQ